VHAASVLDNVETENAEQEFGVQIIRRAVEAPLRQISENAGLEGSVVVNRVKTEGKKTFGYNAKIDKFEDLVAAGIIDPAKVVRSALQNAASVAGLMLTTETIIAELPKADSAGGPPMGGMPGGMGGMPMM